MKHSIEQLLLASAIRKLAVDLRHGEAVKALPALDRAAIRTLGDSPDASSTAFDDWMVKRDAATQAVHAEWYKSNPLDGYVQRAMRMLDETAATIFAPTMD